MGSCWARDDECPACLSRLESAAHESTGSRDPPSPLQGLSCPCLPPESAAPPPPHALQFQTPCNQPVPVSTPVVSHYEHYHSTLMIMMPLPLSLQQLKIIFDFFNSMKKALFFYVISIDLLVGNLLDILLCCGLKNMSSIDKSLV